MNARAIPLLLFAKAPIAGQVKTRLQPQCSAQESAEVAQILLRESLQRAEGDWPGEVKLCVWPAAPNQFLSEVAAQIGVTIVAQTTGDLGMKMHNAMQSHGYPCAVMGCDVPEVGRQDLVQAHAALQQGRDVIGPTADGGYYLLGLSSSAAPIFEDVAWGTADVLEQTLQRFKALDRRPCELTPRNDIDCWEDLVASQVPALQDWLKRRRPPA
ncbi:MAG: glycosyltransferase [Gammaproteobacteria bacterium]|nr:glycosyltransferase [Gammaproteobacteria bacterium]